MLRIPKFNQDFMWNVIQKSWMNSSVQCLKINLNTITLNLPFDYMSQNFKPGFHVECDPKFSKEVYYILPK